jgi:glycine/D-amino acid oxidase-like deaminating enzyme
MDFDHAVIGAGVIGAASAYHLKRLDPGSSVVLIDREKRPGAGNTAKSAALYRNIFSSRASQLLATSTIRYFLTMPEKLQIRPIGYLWMFSKEQWSASSEAISKLGPVKDGIDVWDVDRLRKALKVRTDGDGPFPGVHKGLLGRLCGSLSGMSVAEHYVESFKELGGEVMLGREVKTFELKNEGTRYAPWAEQGLRSIGLSDGGRLTSKDFLFCLGAWSQEVLGRLGVFTSTLPKKRQLFGIRVDDPSQIVQGLDLDKVPALILPAGGAYIKPLLDRKLLITGLADDLGQPYDLDSGGPDEDYFRDAISPVLSHYFPNLRDWELKMRWSGHYSYHWPDKNPVVENVSNLHWAAGTSGSGIMKADAVGRVAASRVLGRDTAELFDGSVMTVGSLSLRRRDAGLETFVI